MSGARAAVKVLALLAAVALIVVLLLTVVSPFLQNRARTNRVPTPVVVAQDPVQCERWRKAAATADALLADATRGQDWDAAELYRIESGETWRQVRIHC